MMELARTVKTDDGEKVSNDNMKQRLDGCIRSILHLNSLIPVGK